MESYSNPAIKYTHLITKKPNSLFKDKRKENLKELLKISLIGGVQNRK